MQNTSNSVKIKYNAYAMEHNIPDNENHYFKCPYCDNDSWYENDDFYV